MSVTKLADRASSFALAPRAPRETACGVAVRDWTAPIDSASVVLAASTACEATAAPATEDVFVDTDTTA